jgi:hypothetical protein
LESTSNIFQKLKKTQKEQHATDVIDELVEQKQYMEQKSAPLPEVKQEHIIISKTTNNVIQTTPIIPTNEIVKQINEMNTKINDLYDMIHKLTKLVENKGDHNSIPTTDIRNTDIY